MKRLNLIGTMLVATMILALVGCQMFDNSPTEVAAPDAGLSPMSDFLMGAPELDSWGAYYVKGGAFVRLDIPKSGAIKVEYSTVGGWKGAIFLETSKAAGLEIGVKDDDVIDSVCVTYAEGGSFSLMPDNVEESMKNDWTHYKRLTDDGTSDWWPTDAAFTFSAEPTTACGVVNSAVQWDVIPGGAFEKPSAEPEPEPEPANAAPVASNVSFGELKLGEPKLRLRPVSPQYKGSYDYSDAENDVEGTSLYQWYQADDVNGANKQVIEGATEITYTDSTRKCLAFEVTPVANTGTLTGAPVLSEWGGNDCMVD